MKLSSKGTEDSDDENNFPHKLLLTNRQISKLRKAYANKDLANVKLSKTHLDKLRQSDGFLSTRLVPLLKSRSTLIKNVLKPLANSVLILPGLAAAAPSATDVAIHKKMFGSARPWDLAWHVTVLIILNEEMYDIMKIVESLEESGLLIKVANETIKNEAKEPKGRFLGRLLGTSGASLLGDLLAGKGTIRAS